MKYLIIVTNNRIEYCNVFPEPRAPISHPPLPGRVGERLSHFPILAEATPHPHPYLSFIIIIFFFLVSFARFVVPPPNLCPVPSLIIPRAFFFRYKRKNTTRV